jgi:hypothetical protein
MTPKRKKPWKMALFEQQRMHVEWARLPEARRLSGKSGHVCAHPTRCDASSAVDQSVRHRTSGASAEIND